VNDETRQLRATIEAALAAHDKPVAVRSAAEAVSSRRVGVAELYHDVLLPMLVDLGARWQAGERHVWEEHLASAAVRTIVELVYPEVLKLKAAAPATGRSVLLACPPQEAHDLGLRMLADRFEMAGWTAYFLGADTPPSEIADAARVLGVDGIALSSSTHFHRLAVRHLVDELKSGLPGVGVWVGGPAFAHDREGWADDELLDLDGLLGGPGR
jgi:methanogenic corrinoid protein MtbC1